MLLGTQRGVTLPLAYEEVAVIEKQTATQQTRLKAVCGQYQCERQPGNERKMVPMVTRTAAVNEGMAAETGNGSLMLRKSAAKLTSALERLEHHHGPLALTRSHRLASNSTQSSCQLCHVLQDWC